MMKNILVFIVLPVLAIVLTYFLITGINEPVRFKQAKEYREKLAVKRLKDIRDVQVAYKSQYGKFTDNFDTLINFYNNGMLKIVQQFGSLDDSVAVAQKKVQTNTINVPVRDNIKLRSCCANWQLLENDQYCDNCLADSLRFVPLVGGEFEMEAVIRRVSGVDVPLFEARVPFDQLLNGLKRQEVVNINAEVEAINKTLTTNKHYSGIKVGSVDQPNNNAGNWE
jgi:hypothetical protein